MVLLWLVHLRLVALSGDVVMRRLPVRLVVIGLVVLDLVMSWRTLLLLLWWSMRRLERALHQMKLLRALRGILLLPPLLLLSWVVV